MERGHGEEVLGGGTGRSRFVAVGFLSRVCVWGEGRRTLPWGCGSEVCVCVRSPACLEKLLRGSVFSETPLPLQTSPEVEKEATSSSFSHPNFRGEGKKKDWKIGLVFDILD